MASLKVINTVKYSPFLYSLYSRVGNILVRILKLFLKPDSNLIMFVSSGGKSMNDSPKFLYDAIIKDERFKNYKICWAFRAPDSYNVPVGDKIQLDSLKYYIKLLQARVWITNVSMQRGLDFDGINTFSVNTWHGTPIKWVGSDASGKKDAFTVSQPKYLDDYILSQGKYETKIWQNAFGIPKEKILEIGLPRNDEFIGNDIEDKKNEIRLRLGIPKRNKVILYAPTFRDYQKEDGKYLILTPPVNFNKWKDVLGEGYTILFRPHPSIVKVMNIKSDNFVIDASSYPCINDFMIASDLMISDYSSVFFDYSILNRPMLCFAYDYDIYSQSRGMYFDIRDELKCQDIDNEDKLLDCIKTLNYEDRINITSTFRKKYVQYYGSATKKVLDLIIDNIENKK